jgi:hypothetical protein
MEFYRTIDIDLTPEQLQSFITLENMERWSSEFFTLHAIEGDRVQIGGLWGEFTLHQMAVRGGVRFTLIECPNALTWSITTGHPPKKDAVHVHLTVNRTAITDEFKEEIEDFIEDHIGMLSALLSEHV